MVERIPVLPSPLSVSVPSASDCLTGFLCLLLWQYRLIKTTEGRKEGEKEGKGEEGEKEMGEGREEIG